MRLSRDAGRGSRFGNLGYILGLVATLPILILFLDGSVRAYILSVQDQGGVAVARWVSAGGYGLVNGAVALALMVAGLILKRPKETLAGRVGLFAVIGGGLSAQVFKHLLCRSRPMTEGAGQFFSVFPCLSESYRMTSFPSGHSVTSFALAYVLSLTYPKGSPVFYGLATTVALSRVYLASHFLSDVVGGAALGLFAGWVVCRLAVLPLANGRS